MKDKLLVLMVAALILVVAVVIVAKPFRNTSMMDGIVDFSLPDLNGTQVNTADLRAGKVFVLTFGTTWCVWCKEEIPHLNQIQQEYADRAAVLEVDVSEPAEKVRAAVAASGAKYLTVLDETGAVAKNYGVQGFPQLIIADAGGNIVYRGNYTTYDVLRYNVEQALKGGR